MGLFGQGNGVRFWPKKGIFSYIFNSESLKISKLKKLPDNFKLYRNSKSKFTSGSDRICFLGANDFKEDFTCTNNLGCFLWKVLMKKIFNLPWLFAILFNMEISINSEHLG